MGRSCLPLTCILIQCGAKLRKDKQETEMRSVPCTGRFYCNIGSKAPTSCPCGFYCPAGASAQVHLWPSPCLLILTLPSRNGHLQFLYPLCVQPSPIIPTASHFQGLIPGYLKLSDRYLALLRSQ
jgi:hypothetical protein